MFERGPANSKWLIIGEAPGEDEDKAGRPFIGPSGKLLNRLLAQAGFDIKLDEWGNRLSSPFHITNVFTSRPPENDLKSWTLNKTELQKLGYTTTGRLPQLNKRYIHPEHEGEVARLHEEIRQLQPEFILALGGTALWALTGEARITINRGTLLPVHLSGRAMEVSPSTDFPQQAPSLLPPSTSTQPPSPPTPNSALASQSTLPQWAHRLAPLWCLPAFHPAMVLRQWDNRSLLWADLSKARRFLTHSLSPPLRRCLLIDPSLEDLADCHTRWLARSASCNDPLGVDIETDPRIGQITTISFGFADEAVCIPLWNKGTLPAQCNYWRTAREEAEAWRWIMRFAALPHPKVLQNGLYDMQYLLEDLDIRLRNVSDDTAILQHCLQPELPKALGTIASLYLNEPAWKIMRESAKDAKADD